MWKVIAAVDFFFILAGFLLMVRDAGMEAKTNLGNKTTAHFMTQHRREPASKIRLNARAL